MESRRISSRQDITSRSSRDASNRSRSFDLIRQLSIGYDRSSSPRDAAVQGNASGRASTPYDRAFNTYDAAVQRNSSGRAYSLRDVENKGGSTSGDHQTSATRDVVGLGSTPSGDHQISIDLEAHSASYWEAYAADSGPICGNMASECRRLAEEQGGTPSEAWRAIAMGCNISDVRGSEGRIKLGQHHYYMGKKIEELRDNGKFLTSDGAKELESYSKEIKKRIL